MKIKVLYKLFLSKFKLVPSFCKLCGRDVHDFVAPDELWKGVEPNITSGNVLCYDCFCELIRSKGHLGVFRLEEIE